MTDLLAMLRRQEWVRLKPYHDSVGKLTIGIGRNLDDVGISQDEADFLLLNDVTKAKADLTKAFSWFITLDWVRQDVLTDMVFNMGLSRFQGFHQTIASLEQHHWSDAAKEMLDSTWAGQVGARATELSAMMETGNYQV